MWQHQLRDVGYSNPRNIRVLADARGTRCLSKAETGTGERFAPNSKVASNQSRRIKEWRLASSMRTIGGYRGFRNEA